MKQAKSFKITFVKKKETKKIQKAYRKFNYQGTNMKEKRKHQMKNFTMIKKPR